MKLWKVVEADGISILHENIREREGKGWEEIGADGISILHKQVREREGMRCGWS